MPSRANHAPKWKVYLGAEFIASCRYPEDAAALVAAHRDGGYVYYNHDLCVWQEGKEEFWAGENYDRAADIMRQRVKRERSKQ
jgi:hypothetical protein